MRTAARYQAWPRWARIAAPVSAVVLALGVIGAATGNSGDDKAATAEVLGLVVTTTPGEASSAYLERPASEIPPNETPISEQTSAEPSAPTTASPSDCHPSYEPCVPNTSDIDCAGGAGDGPWYTGRVTVIGPDVYGLDSDRNGVGCDELGRS